MIRKVMNNLLVLRDRQSMWIAANEGEAMMLAKKIDLTPPGTWKVARFSQNGEAQILLMILLGKK